MRVVRVGCDQVIICQLHEVVACLFNIFGVIFEELMYFQNHTKKPYLSGPKVGHCHSRGKGLEAQLNTCKYHVGHVVSQHVAPMQVNPYPK